MDYPKEVINYAIDNKVSLEEAYEIFLLASEELAEDKEVNMDDHHNFVHCNLNIILTILLSGLGWGPVEIIEDFS